MPSGAPHGRLLSSQDVVWFLVACLKIDYQCGVPQVSESSSMWHCVNNSIHLLTLRSLVAVGAAVLILSIGGNIIVTETGVLQGKEVRGCDGWTGHGSCWTLTQESCVYFLLPIHSNGCFDLPLQLFPNANQVIFMLELEHPPTSVSLV